MPDDNASTNEVLELRIHGVNNTSPASLLGLGADSIRQDKGDELGSFWTPTTEPEAIEIDGEPATIRREAYSWGAQARYVGPGGTGGKAWPLRISRAAWLTLIPLGITNTAYWSRALVLDTAGGGESRRRYGPGLRRTLLFGLGLTLLLVTAAMTASLDLVATQCLADRPAHGDTARCPSLPKPLWGLADLPWGQRMVIMSSVPLAVLAVVALVSLGSRNRYERADSRVGLDGVRRRQAQDRGPKPLVAILSQERMWSRWGRQGRVSALHVSAAVSLVATVMAWSAWWAEDERCDDLRALERACFQPTEGNQLYVVQVVAGTVLTLAAAGRLLREYRRGGDGRTPLGKQWFIWLLAFLACALLGWVEVALWHTERAPTMAPAPTMVTYGLTAGLVVTALSASTWRMSRSRRIGGLVAGVVALGALGAPLVAESAKQDHWAAIILGIALAGGAACAFARRSADVADAAPLAGDAAVADARPPVSIPLTAQAWRGTAPAVFLLLAIGLQVLLICGGLVALGNWFNGRSGVGDLLPRQDAEAETLLLPSLYVAFLAFLVVLAGVVLLALVLVLLFHSWRGARVEPGQVFARAVLRARLVADLLQRGEPLLGLIATGLALALVATLVVPLPIPDAEGLSEAAGLLATSGAWLAATLIAATVIPLLASGGSDRPLGLLWDLMCFLPRTAHPFAPPCYAERAVPEIEARVRDWLFHDGRRRERRFVVLAPHSLGTVLAIAAVMRSPQDPLSGRVALLSYGCQVRPYFGRIFPDLLGPAVLGTNGVQAPPALQPVWRAPSVPLPPATRNLQTCLGDRLSTWDHSPLWINLWRRTDPLGMPAHDTPPVTPDDEPVTTDADRVADEAQSVGYLVTVGTHGFYPETAEYAAARTELIRRMVRARRAETGLQRKLGDALSATMAWIRRQPGRVTPCRQCGRCPRCGRELHKV